MSKQENLHEINDPSNVDHSQEHAVDSESRTENDLDPETLGMESESEPEAEGMDDVPGESTEEILDRELEARRQEIDRLSSSTQATRTKLNEVRAQLGLPPTEEELPSILSEKDRLEQLRSEQETLEEQKQELISEREREQFIVEEKKLVLQEKLDDLFKEFEDMNPDDLNSLFNSGKKSDGSDLESGAMGELDPQTARVLVGAYKEELKSLPEVLKVLPELLKQFDQDLTKEATRRVDERLAMEKAEITEELEEQPRSSDEGESETVTAEPEQPVEEGGVLEEEEAPQNHQD